MRDLNLRELVLIWKEKKGVLTRGKKYDNEYLAIPINDRSYFLQILVRYLKMCGKDKTYFSTDFFFREIVKACFGGAPVPTEVERRRNGALKEELETVVVRVFVKKSRNKGKTSPHRPPPKKVSTEVKAEEISKESEIKRYGRDPDKSTLEKTEAVWDEDFANLLGVKTNE